MRNKTTKFFVIGIVAFAITLTGAYALLNSVINIGGTAQAGADMKVEFESATSSNVNKATAQIGADKTSLTINANLDYPTDSATINFVIKNNGTLSATVEDLAITNNSNPDLNVQIVGLSDLKNTVLAVGEETNGSVVVTWNSASENENPEDVTFNVVIDYTQTIR